MTSEESSTVLQQRYESGDFVLAQYRGANQTHNIGSPSGAIVKYEMTIYGRGRNGDFFLVHKDDVVHKDSKFVAVPNETTRTVEKILHLTPLTLKKVETAQVKEAIKELTTETESTAFEKIEAAAVAEIEDIARQVISEGKILKRSEAISPSAFAEMFGYTHYLQVVAKVKSGELLSYKNEKDKMFVYHVED